jgi:hypothetical protein
LKGEAKRAKKEEAKATRQAALALASTEDATA